MDSWGVLDLTSTAIRDDPGSFKRRAAMVRNQKDWSKFFDFLFKLKKK